MKTAKLINEILVSIEKLIKNIKTLYSNIKESSRGDGVTGAPLLKPILRSHFALAFFARI